jgi:hypothetical protein
LKILEVLSEIPDPRRYNAQHELTDILFVAVVAMLCGATNCTDFAAFAEGRLEFLRQFVPLRVRFENSVWGDSRGSGIVIHTVDVDRADPRPDGEDRQENEALSV